MADVLPQGFRRPAGRDVASRPALDAGLLRAFDAYFAAEQTNLEALGAAADEQPEFLAFYQETLSTQRRSLAQLAYGVASLLPEPPPAARRNAAEVPTRLVAGLGETGAGRLIATSIEAVRTRPFANGFVTGTAAIVAGALVLLATREAVLTPASPIGPRIALAAAQGGAGETAAASSAMVAASTPTPVPTPQPSILERQRVVTMYGHPHATTMGLLGTFEQPRDAARAVKQMARDTQAADGRPSIGALHVIVHTAQADQTPDGTHITRLGEADLRPWVEAARDEGVLLILDTQVGWSDALTETKRLERWLRLPFVHLALDPEFALTPGAAPGTAIGTLDATSVNAVQAYLGDLVRQEGVPRKMLMLHQFMDHMLTGTARYADDPEIEIVVDFDGYGASAAKIDGYARYAVAPYAERPAIKIFTEHDTPVMGPADVARLLRERADALGEAVPALPDVIVYQ